MFSHKARRSRRVRRSCYNGALVELLQPRLLLSSTEIWVGGQGTGAQQSNINYAPNWSLGTVPGAGDTAVFDGTGDYSHGELKLTANFGSAGAGELAEVRFEKSGMTIDIGTWSGFTNVMTVQGLGDATLTTSDAANFETFNVVTLYVATGTLDSSNLTVTGSKFCLDVTDHAEIGTGTSAAGAVHATSGAFLRFGVTGGTPGSDNILGDAGADTAIISLDTGAHFLTYANALVMNGGSGKTAVYLSNNAEWVANGNVPKGDATDNIYDDGTGNISGVGDFLSADNGDLLNGPLSPGNADAQFGTMTLTGVSSGSTTATAGSDFSLGSTIDASGDASLLAVNGTLTLGGVLQVNLTSGSPSTGTTYTIATASSIAGYFSDISTYDVPINPLYLSGSSLPGLSSGLFWELHDYGTSLVLEVVGTPSSYVWDFEGSDTSDFYGSGSIASGDAVSGSNAMTITGDGNWTYTALGLTAGTYQLTAWTHEDGGGGTAVLGDYWPGATTTSEPSTSTAWHAISIEVTVDDGWWSFSLEHLGSGTSYFDYITLVQIA